MTIFFCFHWCEKLIKDKSELLQQQQSSSFPSLIHIYIFTSYWGARKFLSNKKKLIYFIKKTELCDCLDCCVIMTIFCVSYSNFFHHSLTHPCYNFLKVYVWLARKKFWELPQFLLYMPNLHWIHVITKCTATLPTFQMYKL